MSESGLDAGKIRFFNHSLPALDAGPYQLKVSQIVDVQKIAADPAGSRTYAYTQTMLVRAPRFRFNAGDVHSVYPPPLSEGEFTTTIPHVVLRRRTLPWERALDTQPPPTTGPKPWLALLVFRDSELSDVTVQTGAVQSLMLPDTPPNGVALPQFDFAGPRAAEKVLELEKVNQADPQVTTIDIRRATFVRVAPRMDDLKWLAHVRQVNTGDKELLGQIEDGWFSVVLANRVPVVGGNTAHLVSLEGCKGLLEQAAAGTLAKDAVRLVSLASWKFAARKSSGNFAEIVNNLEKGLLRLEPPASLHALASGNNAGASAARVLEGALNAGYTPLTYRLRSGEVTAGWYRGPCSPVPTPRALRDPFPTAEAGLIYDPDTGMFDLSNATAWQIGRLLALADARFAAALGEWRQAGQLVLDRMIRLAEDARDREHETIWRKIGEIQAPPSLEVLADPEALKQDRERRKRELATLLADTGNLKEMLASLADPNAARRPLADNVVEVYEQITSASGVQPRQETKTRLTDAIAGKLNQAYAAAAGRAGVFAAAAFRDEVLR
jgi:hypothetical protein